MRILITGAFGNLGVSTLKSLLYQEHEIICLDIQTKKAQKIQKKLLKIAQFETVWGSVTDKETVRKCIKKVDSIIHLAGILHPYTERNPNFAYKINVDGTRIICEVALEQKTKPKIILASSVSIYGPIKPSDSLTTAEDKINPIDVYTHSKAEAEKVVKTCGLPWLILRVTAAPPLKLVGIDYLNLLFEIPLKQHVEFGHTLDVGTAFVNAAIRDIKNKILLISGGEKNRMINRVFVRRYLETIGIGMISEWAFKRPEKPQDWYYVDWLDTEESQALLEYQHHTFDDFLNEMQKNLGLIRGLIRILSPAIRKYIESKSPYMKK